MGRGGFARKLEIEGALEVVPSEQLGESGVGEKAGGLVRYSASCAQVLV